MIIVLCWPMAWPPFSTKFMTIPVYHWAGPKKGSSSSLGSGNVVVLVLKTFATRFSPLELPGRKWKQLVVWVGLCICCNCVGTVVSLSWKNLSSNSHLGSNYFCDSLSWSQCRATHGLPRVWMLLWEWFLIDPMQWNRTHFLRRKIKWRKNWLYPGCA